VSGVVSHTNAAGDVSIGVEVDGVFVPVSTVPAQRVAHHVERHKTLVERAGDPGAKGHAEAKAALEAEYPQGGTKAPPKPTAKAKEETS